MCACLVTARGAGFILRLERESYPAWKCDVCVPSHSQGSRIYSSLRERELSRLEVFEGQELAGIDRNLANCLGVGQQLTTSTILE
ncbi:hypothetical protein CBR_g12008 [Chara braunii]|uniref:Uncharacterized protein n=1 Tax=Chara braunii TaxID=69332 RepID=A0A388KQW8_CHABU|nr:hypothetical protein CBR_g12008 [Chara braunii]|eukprot:GBG72429.1 hypothetical protein CBR_g12008 [Chara braunii]